MILIDAERLAASRPNRPLFGDVSVTIADGDRVGVVGLNGSGKSTLLRMLAGELRPETGEVRRGRGVRVGFLAQNPTLPVGTVRDAVGSGWRGEAMLDRLGMTPLLDTPTDELSGGQAKRAALAGLLSRTVHPIPGIFAAYGRYTATRLGQADVIYMGEGWNATVAVTRLSGGILNYHNAGKVQASSEPQDMRLQRMLGHLTTLIPRQAKKVVVIGCGAGVTAGAVSIDPAVEHQTIAEIEPLVPKVVAKYFGEHNFHVVDNPKVHIRIDDARHYLLTTNEKFDAITSDPLDPWVKGAAMLYTEEFFNLAKSKLNPGGAITLFVQLYESNTEAVKSEIATFMKVFPNGIVWGNTNNGAGYDLVLLGQVEDTKIDVDAIQARLQRPEYAPMAQSLREIGMNNAVDLFSTFAGRAKDLQPWLADASINRDRNLRLQFLAGMGLNLYQSDAIYSGMLAYAHRFPDELFVGSPETLDRLRAGIMKEQGR